VKKWKVNLHWTGFYPVTVSAENERSAVLNARKFMEKTMEEDIYEVYEEINDTLDRAEDLDKAYEMRN